VMACESRQVSPLMRVSGVNEAEILKALEIGVHGLHVPNIKNSKDIKSLISYSKYPPTGTRGFSPFTRACEYSSDNAKEMVEKANSETLLIVHIEGEDGIRNIDSILDESDGIDIFFLGLYDISNYLGIPGEVTKPEILDLFTNLVSKIKKSGNYCGTIANSMDQLSFFYEVGVNYVTYSVDCHVIKKAYKDVVSFTKRV